MHQQNTLVRKLWRPAIRILPGVPLLLEGCYFSHFCPFLWGRLVRCGEQAIRT
ncbi:hypothetical protein DPMN_038827 [Dreissena polymorpha]|uniref:Uncharacterized protein n=1 Tax=Dreissena polymorpha TaxID=45954 RepID=A0A9D4MH32_DREPO|nr:hypothetical protein DPMN_038827 [Dreissena polymorpha]